MVVISSGPATAQQPLPWYELELPGPVAGLAAAVGVSPDRPRAQLALDVIRTVHAVPPGHSRSVDAARAKVAGWLASSSFSPGSHGASVPQTIPSPLPESAWRVLLPGATRQRIGDAVLLDRRAALLSYGLWGVDAATRASIASRPDLLATIYREHAAAFAAFGRSLHVERGRVSLDVPYPAAWEALVGERLSNPDDFIPKLLAQQRGRLAYCLDTVTALDAPRRVFLLGPPTQDRDDGERRVRGLARLCAAMRPEWDATQQPFVRPVIDLGAMLGALVVDVNGTLVGPQAAVFWARVFEPGTLPSSAAKWTEQVARAEHAEPEWLLRQVLEVDIATSQARLRAVRFAQRRFADSALERSLACVRATRSVIDLPALALVLERIGVRDAATFAAAAAAAPGLVHAESADRARATVLQFQGALALIDRARFSAALDDASAVALVESLLRITPERGHDYAGALADWITADLVPAVRTRTSLPPSDDVEMDVAAALSGVGAPLRTAPGGDIVEWEGLPYKADPGAAEFARFTRLRERLGSASLSDALALRRDARALSEASSYDAARASIASLARRLTGVPRHADRPGGDTLATMLDDVLDDLPAKFTRADRMRDEVRRLTEASDLLLADALEGMVYAIHLGQPDGIVGLAPDAARRHRFATRLDPLGAAWDLPAEVTGGGATWHVAGALLGLDLALAPLVLSDGLGDNMPTDPRLTGPDRRTLAHGLVQMSPFALADTDRDAIAAALARGRARIEALQRDATLAESVTRDASWSAWRRGTLDYTLAHDADAVPRLFTLSDGFWLGATSDEAASLDAWGTVAVAPDGGLTSAWPARRQREDLVGRAGSGLLGGHFIDATLRVVETLARLQMPAALVPGVLRSALPDLAYRAQMASEDDWFGLASHARDWTDVQMDDYIAALTAAGPLVVPDPEAGTVRR